MSTIPDLISQLVAVGVSAGDAAAVVSQAFALGAATVGKVHDPAAERRRAWDRERKARKARAAVSTGKSAGIPPEPAPVISAGIPPERRKRRVVNSAGIPVERPQNSAGIPPEMAEIPPENPVYPPISSLSFFADSAVKKESEKGRKKERKNRVAEKNSPVPRDDWPDDYAKLFWQAWPSHERKFGEKHVAAKLAKIRASGDATWADVFGGEQRYFASNPDPKYIPGLLPWLNQEKWKVDYRPRPIEPPKQSFLSYAMERMDHGR